MLKKSLLITFIAASVFMSPVFADDDYLNSEPSKDESQAGPNQTADLNGQQLSSEEKSAIDNDQKQFEDELQTLHASNATGSDPSAPTSNTPQEQQQSNLAQRSQNQESENLQKYQMEKPEDTSKIRW
jgi:hypothetical protein